MWMKGFIGIFFSIGIFFRPSGLILFCLYKLLSILLLFHETFLKMILDFVNEKEISPPKNEINKRRNE